MCLGQHLYQFIKTKRQIRKSLGLAITSRWANDVIMLHMKAFSLTSAKLLCLSEIFKATMQSRWKSTYSKSARRRSFKNSSNLCTLFSSSVRSIILICKHCYNTEIRFDQIYSHTFFSDSKLSASTKRHFSTMSCIYTSRYWERITQSIHSVYVEQP